MSPGTGRGALAVYATRLAVFCDDQPERRDKLRGSGGALLAGGMACHGTIFSAVGACQKAVLTHALPAQDV